MYNLLLQLEYVMVMNVKKLVDERRRKNINELLKPPKRKEEKYTIFNDLDGFK